MNVWRCVQSRSVGRCVVTGASGLLGRAVMAELQRAGVDVVVRFDWI